MKVGEREGERVGEREGEAETAVAAPAVITREYC